MITLANLDMLHSETPLLQHNFQMPLVLVNSSRDQSVVTDGKIPQCENSQIQFSNRVHSLIQSLLPYSCSRPADPLFCQILMTVTISWQGSCSPKTTSPYKFGSIADFAMFHLSIALRGKKAYFKEEEGLPFARLHCEA